MYVIYKVYMYANNIYILLRTYYMYVYIHIIYVIYIDLYFVFNNFYNNVILKENG